MVGLSCKCHGPGNGAFGEERGWLDRQMASTATGPAAGSTRSRKRRDEGEQKLACDEDLVGAVADARTAVFLGLGRAAGACRPTMYWGRSRQPQSFATAPPAGQHGPFRLAAHLLCCASAAPADVPALPPRPPHPMSAASKARLAAERARERDLCSCASRPSSSRALRPANARPATTLWRCTSRTAPPRQARARLLTQCSRPWPSWLPCACPPLAP